MKNFIYYNSVAAHPHHQMGHDKEDHQDDGLWTHQRLDIKYDIYNGRNKTGEVIL
jgi:aromatic ring-cleaving dioxygenase